MFGNNPKTADKANAEKADLEFVTDAQEASSLAGTIMVNRQEKIFKSSNPASTKRLRKKWTMPSTLPNRGH
jgi:hypothetical protein